MSGRDDSADDEWDAAVANALTRVDRSLATATGADKDRLEKEADVLASWFSWDVR